MSSPVSGCCHQCRDLRRQYGFAKEEFRRTARKAAMSAARYGVPSAALLRELEITKAARSEAAAVLNAHQRECTTTSPTTTHHTKENA